MSIKHLASGSFCPPLSEGILRVYNMRYCPFAERTLLVLHAKNIPHEVVNVNLKHKPEWLKQKNPLEKVPILEQNGKIINESLHTCDYLEENFPGPSLYPKEPWMKYAEKALVDYFDAKVINPQIRLLFRFNDPSKAASHLSEMKKGFFIFEKELLKRGTKFFGGNKPGMVDYMVWPWFERLPVFEAMLQEPLFSSAECPTLYGYMEDMKKDKAVQEVLLPVEEHKKYVMSVISGEFKYDFEPQMAKL